MRYLLSIGPIYVEIDVNDVTQDYGDAHRWVWRGDGQTTIITRKAV